MRNRSWKPLALAGLYIMAIVAANYAIGHWGDQPVAPGAPHTLPVWPGVAAPSGVYLIGLILVLRDTVQRAWGVRLTFALVVLASVVTAVFAPSFAVASMIAFFVSETVDLAVFTWVSQWSFKAAILASNAVSIVVDSLLFLTLAFSSLAFFDGQVIGKVWGTVIGFAVIAWLDMRRSRAAVAA